MWYVYFLQLSNDDIYVGSTNDLKRRLSLHQTGAVLSTRAYLPVVLKSYVAVETEQHAREVEACSVVEAKPEGNTRSGVAEQVSRCQHRLPSHLAAWGDPLRLNYRQRGKRHPQIS